MDKHTTWGMWAVVAVGWLNALQPWLTALATILAIAWTAMQMYDKWKQKRKKD